jgi:hypothetical protein
MDVKVMCPFPEFFCMTSYYYIDIGKAREPMWICVPFVAKNDRSSQRGCTKKEGFRIMELRRENYIKEEVDQDEKENYYNCHFSGCPGAGIMHYGPGKS